MLDCKCPLCKAPNDSPLLCKECHENQLNKMEYVEIELPYQDFIDLGDIISCSSMMNNKAKGYITIGNKLYIATGASGGGIESDLGWTEIWGHEIIPLDKHDGSTYTYNELDIVNGTGGYFHSNNQKFTIRGKEFVVVPYKKIIFTLKESTKVTQKSLF